MNRFPRIILLAILLILSWVTININGGKDDWKSALESDAKGYYAYLPAVFIYHDLNFTFLEVIEEKYDQKHLYYDYRNSIDGKLFNKYYAGVAVAQLPFFLIAHLVSAIDGQDLDGYTKWYMYAINVAAIFYHLLGLFFFYRLLRNYLIKPHLVAIVIIALSFGTNLFAYTVVEPGMSHVYSFAFISVFLYYAHQFFHKTDARKSLLWMGISFGMLVLCRPVNGLIVFALPIIAASFSNLLVGMRKLIHKSAIIPFSVVILLFGIQLFAYKIAAGKLWVYSYLNEGFDFLNPHFIDILFSYKKGLFLYTPFYFLGFISAFYFIRRKPFLFWSWMAFFFIITYVFSSWWMWYYGGSFSSRVYVEYLPLFALPLALILQELENKKVRVSIMLALALIVVICQIQTYQYRYYEIHYSEMNKEKYWEVFLMRNKL